MSTFPKTFRHFVPQLIQMIVLPIFFFAFMLIYRPDGIDTFLKSDMYGVHITIIKSKRIRLMSVGFFLHIYGSFYFNGRDRGRG